MTREKVLLSSILAGVLLISVRLYYWQIVKGSTLQAIADRQSQRQIISSGNRGKIYTSEGSLLVGNQEYFRLSAEPYKIDIDPEELANKIAEVTIVENDAYTEATDEAMKKDLLEEKESLLEEKLSGDHKWVTLDSKITP